MVHEPSDFGVLVCVLTIMEERIQGKEDPIPRSPCVIVNKGSHELSYQYLHIRSSYDHGHDIS
jgi:hypothetical protein